MSSILAATGRAALVLAAITAGGSPAGAQSPMAPAAPAEQRQQLQAARKELAQSLTRLQKRMDGLPEAADPMQRVEAEMKAQIAEIDKRIAARSEGASAPPRDDKPTATPRRRQPVTFSVESAFGFDRQSVVAPAPSPTAAATGRHEEEPEPSLPPVLVKRDVKRTFSSTVLTAEYPLTRDTTTTLVVPYIYQTQRSSALGQSAIRRASGIGDIGLFVERHLPEVAAGAGLSLAAGMQFPTGKDPYGLKASELPTGVGFYQPTFRVSLQKLLVPLQIYGVAEYGTSFSRSVYGQRLRLPDSFGGQLGVVYAIGPEFTVQTSVSLRQVTSPLLLGPGATVGYLSQAIDYRTGDQTSFRGSVDMGLTEDSLDFVLGASLRSRF